MQKVTVHCSTGRHIVEQCTQAESDALTALATQPDQGVQARVAAAQLQSDMSAVVSQYRTKTNLESVTGEQPA